MIRKDISEYQARDDLYIDAFTENPKAGKSAALVKAGYEGDYIAQEAYRVHKRLQERIDNRLNDQIKEGANLGYSILKELALGAENESVKAKCAIALMDYSGRKPGDTLIVKENTMTQEQRRERIEFLQAKNKEARAAQH